MSSSAARRRPSAPATSNRSARFPVAPAHPEPGTVRRGLSVVLEVPTDGPGTAELLSLAGTLHELALDLVPGATARTEVHLLPAPGTTDRGRP